MKILFQKITTECLAYLMLLTIFTGCNILFPLFPTSKIEAEEPTRKNTEVIIKRTTDSAYPATLQITSEPVLVSTPDQLTNDSIWVTPHQTSLANHIRTMLVVRSGDLWAGGPGGVVNWVLNTGQYTTYVNQAKPTESNVVTLAQTPDNGIWIGTFGYGITRIDPIKQWQTFTTRNGLPSNYIATLLSGPDGIIWVDTSPYTAEQMNPGRGYLGQFDGINWTPGIGGGFFRIVASHNGDLWAIVRMQVGQHWESYISVFRGKKWETVNIGQKTSSITAITVAPDGKVWVAAKTGIYLNDGYNWKIITPPWNDTIVANVSSIEVTEKGEAWFGFSVGVGIFGDECGDRMINTEEIGVYRYDGQSWTHFTDKDGLLDNKVCDITLDQDGNVLFGTFDKGISLFDGNKWASFVIKD